MRDGFAQKCVIPGDLGPHQFFRSAGTQQDLGESRCGECGHDLPQAFSCKGRGVCPSCNTRRMVETAAHLADHVFPRLPLRQWVLAVPKRLRYFLRHDPKLQGAALRLFLRAVEQCLRAHSAGAGPTARLGAVAFIHRFGSALNAHLHFHCVVLDGEFASAPAGVSSSTRSPGSTGRLFAAVQAAVRRRLRACFVRRGRLERDAAHTMVQWQHGGGFAVDGSVRIEAADRAGRERLLRHCARPPFALDRLQQGDAEHLLYEASKPGPGSSGAQRLTPLQRIDRLAALRTGDPTPCGNYFGPLQPQCQPEFACRSAYSAV